MFETNATNLTRLINCNGSASMPKFETAIANTNSIIRDEGIAAHYMAVRLNSGEDISNLIGKTAPNGIFMTEEMQFSVNEYTDYINNRNCIFSEMESETSHQNGDFYRVNGRADNITYASDNTLYVDDFKYGYRIVEPYLNWTLISHAIGYCAARPGQPLPNKFVFSIIQPRSIHVDGTIRSWEIDQDYFASLWQHLANTLCNLTNELNTGDHCKNCPSLAYCSAATKAGYNAVEVSDMVFQETMTNEELSYAMDLLNTSIQRAKNKLDALEEMALHKIKSGEVIENYMQETSLGNTTWAGYVNPNLIKVLTGIDIQSGKMVTPNQAMKMGVPKNIVEMTTHRPNRGVKLKRTSANDKANKMFSHMKGGQNGN